MLRDFAETCGASFWKVCVASYCYIKLHRLLRPKTTLSHLWHACTDSRTLKLFIPQLFASLLDVLDLHDSSREHCLCWFAVAMIQFWGLVVCMYSLFFARTRSQLLTLNSKSPCELFHFRQEPQPKPQPLEIEKWAEGPNQRKEQGQGSECSGMIFYSNYPLNCPKPF